MFNGLDMSLGLEYSERKPLFNTTDYAVIKSEDQYSSNHPLLPLDETAAIIDRHNLVKMNIGQWVIIAVVVLIHVGGVY